jgi:O-antigen ligase
MPSFPSVTPLFIALTALVGLFFGCVAYRRPAYAVALLILIGPFAFYHAIGATTLTLPKIALIGAAVGLLVRRPTPGLFKARISRLVLLSCVAVVIAAAVSIAVAAYRGPAIRETFKAVEYLALFVVAAVAYDSDPDANAVLLGCFVTSAVVAGLAIAQEFVGSPTALMNAGHVVFRIAGPLEGPNQLSGYLGIMLPILAVQCALRVKNVACYVVLALVIIADFLTFSRAGVASGLVGTAAALAAYGLGSARIWFGLFVVPIVLGLIAVVISGGSVARFFSSNSQLGIEGLGTRHQLWSAALQLWRQHPILGIGGDNYEFELARAGYPELHTHPNSQFLQALVEEGLPGIAAFTWATLQPLISLWPLRKDPVIAGIWGACLALGLHQIFDSMSFFPKVAGLLWLLVGVGVAHVVRERVTHLA